jgi:hypothetical protein
MAKSKSRKRKRKSIRKNTSFFKSSDAKTFEQYVMALLITGLFTGAGTVIGTVLGKFLLKEADKTLPLGESFHSAVEKT